MNGKTFYLAFLAVIFTLLLHPWESNGQDSVIARQIIRKLASKQMHGRGYVHSGDTRAAKWISKEFREWALRPFGGSYYQEFPLSINTIRGKTSLWIDGEKLRPGIEYLISASSPGTRGTFPLLKIMPDSSGTYEQISGLSPVFVVTRGDIKAFEEKNPFESAGIIMRVNDDENLGWHVSGASRISESPVVQVRSDKLGEDPKELSLRFRNHYLKDHLARNVAAFIPGMVSDSFVIITAHYDHLGMMGRRTMFPGANDNASGTALMMNLAAYYARQEQVPYYNMVFVALAAEEAGLLGSSFLAEHPLFPLEKVKFLINLDMVGTGSDGITVVNGKVFERAYGLLISINDRKGYVRNIKARGEACNSDHCPFYLKGVPSFFIYTRGEDYKEYHNPADREEDLPMTAYNGLFCLIRDFIDSLPHTAYGKAISRTYPTGEHP